MNVSKNMFPIALRRTFLILLFAILPLAGAAAGDVEVRGPQGALSAVITLPDGFNTETGRCPMVILMHGVFSSKDYNPMPALSKGLAAAGIASIRFDFDGHGKSEGRMEDMTVEKEIADAMAVWEYVKGLPYVSETGFLGHSQGGVVASMTAGRLAEAGSDVPKAMVLLAPGSIIKEACQAGRFFNARFDPKDPPAFIRCWLINKLGREYLVSTQTLDIFGTASAYKGPRTASCRYGAASAIKRRMATRRSSPSSTGRIIRSTVAAPRWSPARWLSSGLFLLFRLRTLKQGFTC